MPPTLDLSGATHSKMIVAPPRINLRRAASYQGDKGPLSSTSSRFSFNHLTFASPPPSPRLPTLVPLRPRKTSNPPRPSRVLKTLLFIVIAAAMVYLSISTLCNSRAVILWLEPEADQFDMVGQAGLPDFPTPIVFDDKSGNPRWTVFIPPEQPFPLSIQGYADMLSMCRGVSLRVHDLRNQGRTLSSSHHNPSRLVSGDAYFVDVRESEGARLLPGSAVGFHKGGLSFCSSSLTYVLESTDAGIGKSLMMMWTAYGLAQRQGRAFFIDDTRWAYGKFTGIFKQPPDPECRAPRRHEILPCPYHARHLVVNFASAQDYFSASLDGTPKIGAPKEMSSSQLRERFVLARTGYEALFRLNAQDAEYVRKRTTELRGQTRAPPGQRDGVVIGLHVRRGDRHPIEYQYRDSYLPYTAYIDMARKLLAGNGKPSIQILASDDPTVYESDDFSGMARAQELIKLASKTAIQQVNPNKDRGVMHKFVDDTFGWEGGFFAAMFWNLGLSSASAAHSPHKQTVMATKTASAPSEDTARLRSYMGRAYMMDLAVLADASDAVVCTVSAMGCRLLGIMMGWERAFEDGKWVNIDGDYGWDGGAW